MQSDSFGVLIMFISTLIDIFINFINILLCVLWLRILYHRENNNLYYIYRNRFLVKGYHKSLLPLLSHYL